MKFRFYINDDDKIFGDTNHVITSEGKEIEYSYMCSSDDSFPPEDGNYRLVYQNNDGNFGIRHNLEL